MKIQEALPHIFKRTYPIIERGTEILLAASLLRFHQIDAIPIGLERRQKKHLAVVGYSCLANLMKIEPSNYPRFLQEPCEKSAQELSVVRADAEIEDLFELFDRTKFGFAWVEGEFELGALVSLRDLLGLYGNGILSTALSVDQVASTIFSMPSDSTIRSVLAEMFNHKFRRIFVGNKVVTDRRIIGYLFSGSRIEILEESKDPLSAPVGELEMMKPRQISSKTKLKEAAAKMESEIEECLISESGLITPWDAIMKPWKMNELEIK
jgi:CBS domain-containing protein